MCQAVHKNILDRLLEKIVGIYKLNCSVSPQPCSVSPQPCSVSPNPAQSAPNPASVNMSTQTGMADPNISWSYLNTR